MKVIDSACKSKEKAICTNLSDFFIYNNKCFMLLFKKIFSCFMN